LDTYIGRFYYQVAFSSRIRLYLSSSGQTNKNGPLYTGYRENVRELARLFRDNVWKLHGLSESIISDRGPQFIAGLMRELNSMLGIESKLSTAFHPQTDEKTKRVNQELE